MEPMYYIGMDVHKRKISYCVNTRGEESERTYTRAPP
jgi:hypothetical protein